MNYLLDKKKNNKKKILILIFGLVFLLFISYQFSFGKVLTKTFQYLATPIWQTKIYLNNKIQDYTIFLVSKEDLFKENQQLKKDQYFLEGRMLITDALLKENIELKESLSRQLTSKSILAVVLAKPNRSPYDTIIIDIGQQQNIKKGDLVQAFDGVVIGQVEEVYNTSSKVKLFSSGGVKTEVSIGQENIYATATGLGGGNFETILPRGVDISEGDYILLPNINTQIIGIVGKIISNPEDSFQRILFKLPLNLSQLKWVQIIKKDDSK